MEDAKKELKLAAAESAAALIQDGMIVGLGSGFTAALAVDAVGRRVAQGLRIAGIPTSEKTARQARELGIPLTSFEEQASLDLTIDGADEVEVSTLNLIKGHGGALLREKIVASVTRSFVIVVDDSKLVDRLGSHFAVPVEVAQFGWQTAARRLGDLGAKAELRQGAEGEPYVSDGGNYILDCRFASIAEPAELGRKLDSVVGVMEHGLFIDMASEVHIAGADGVRTLTRPASAATRRL